MINASPALVKSLLAYLFLLPAVILYLKILFPNLAATGFTEWVQLPLELIFILFVALFFPLETLTRTGKIILSLLFLWNISALIGALQSDHFYASLMKQIEYVIHMLFSYATWVCLSQSNRHTKMLWFLVFTFIWVHYYILTVWHGTPTPYDIDWVVSTPMFSNVRHLGYIQIILLPLLTYPLLARIHYGKLISFGLLTLFWAGVVWSGSRGSFIAAIATCCILSYLFRNQRVQLAFFFITSLIVGWAIALQFPSFSASMDPWRLLFMAEGDIARNDANSISSGRIAIWVTTLTSWWNTNSIWGLGADGYRHISPLIHPGSSHPHNGMVQFLVEFGLVGFLLLIGVIATIAKQLITSFKSNHTPLSSKLAQISILAFIIGALVDGHFYFSFSLIFFAIVMAMSFGRSSPPTPTDRTKVLNLALIMTCIFLMPLMAKHWGSFIEQQFPLLSEEQFSIVEEFPSYYHPVQWFESEFQNPDLLSKALKLGQRIGPRHCNYLLIEYQYSPIMNTDLLSDINEKCRTSEIARFNDPMLEKLLLSINNSDEEN